MFIKVSPNAATTSVTEYERYNKQNKCNIVQKILLHSIMLLHLTQDGYKKPCSEAVISVNTGIIF